jgi:hypothetical protein
MSDNTGTPQQPHGNFTQQLKANWQTIRPVLARVLAWLWKHLQQVGHTVRENQERPFTNRLYTLHLIRYWFWQFVTKWMYALLALASFIAAFMFFWDNPFDWVVYRYIHHEGSPIMGISFLLIGMNFCHHFWVLHTSSRPTDE